MKAAVITGIGKVEIASVDDPAPGPGEVVVAVSACGLCGTDLHIMQGEFAPSLPIIPGHEFAGVVTAVGSGPTDLREGDRVAVDPSLYCHECHYCRIGHDNLCLRWGAIGVTVPGGAAEYVAVPAANCVLAKRTGAASVDVVELSAERLKLARVLGCRYAATSADEMEQPYGWELVVDATGNGRAIQDRLERVAPAGTFLQFGVADYATRVMIDPFRIYNKEITITGSMAVLHSYERATELFATGVLDPATFITDRLPLQDYALAIERFASGAGLKTQVLP